MSSGSTVAMPKKTLAPIWVGTAVLFFFPLGLYLLWKHPTLRNNRRWWLASLAWAVVYVVANLNRSEATNADRNAASDTAPTVETQPQDAPPIKRSFWGPKELAYGKRIDLCDNPDKYKDEEMRMEVLYNGGGRRTGGKLISMPCRVFYGDGTFEMLFDIPKDVSQGRIEPGQYLVLTFIFSGSVDIPSRVITISRK